MIGAARRLFNARGYQHVSLGDIAEEVGLSRTALYRYFPTKAHLVQTWFETAMVPLIEHSERSVAGPGPATARLDRWLIVQLDFILNDEHTALVASSSESDDFPQDVRDHIGARHRELYATLAPLLMPSAREDLSLVRVRTMLIAGLVRSASDLARAGVDRVQVREELSRSARVVAGLRR